MGAVFGSGVRFDVTNFVPGEVRDSSVDPPANETPSAAPVRRLLFVWQPPQFATEFARYWPYSTVGPGVTCARIGFVGPRGSMRNAFATRPSMFQSLARTE